MIDRNTPEYLSRQLESQQAKYNRLCDWIRDRGGDPVAIGNGVEVGPRDRARFHEEYCALLGDDEMARCDCGNVGPRVEVKD